MNEADTCRKLVRPRLEDAGWDTAPHSYNEQTYFTDGRIIATGVVSELKEAAGRPGSPLEDVFLELTYEE